jgi:ATP-binding cassette subfamily G (WHITE) protein 1
MVSACACKRESDITNRPLFCICRYTTMMPGVLRFPAEISILKKEVFNNWYKLRTYYLATLITSTPIHVSSFKFSSLHLLIKLLFQTLFALVYTTVVYFLTEQPPEPSRYLKVILVYVLVVLAADGFGILLGTLVNPVVSPRLIIIFFVLRNQFYRMERSLAQFRLAS